MSPITWLIAGTTLIRLVFAATTGLGVDESYMVTAGRTLSLGYFDHPPASWWLSWAGAHLFGTEAPLAVRLPFILLFALSQLLLWKITVSVADRRAAFWAVVALNLSPVFGTTTGTWVLPDGPLDTALLGAAYCLLQSLERQSLRWWIGAGTCAGLALFSKYSAVLTILGAFLFLLADRQSRRSLLLPGPYLAAVAALLVFSPVLIWNATHHWASFAFQGDRAMGMRFRPLMPLQTLAGEALFVLPWIWVPMMLVLWRGLTGSADERERLLAWLALPPIALFALISAWSSQRILYHWAAPGYLMLFPGVGRLVAERLGSVHVRRAIGGTVVVLLAAIAVMTTELNFDWLGRPLASLGRSDPTAEGIDWTSLRTELQARGVVAPGTPVAALNWRDAGKIGRGLGPDFPIICLNRDSRQFGLANPPLKYAGRDMLVLSLAPEATTEQIAAPWFRSERPLGGASVSLRGRILRVIAVLQGRDLLPSDGRLNNSPPQRGSS